MSAMSSSEYQSQNSSTGDRPAQDPSASDSPQADARWPEEAPRTSSVPDVDGRGEPGSDAQTGYGPGGDAPGGYGVGGNGPTPTAYLPPVNHPAERAAQLGLAFGVLGLITGLLWFVFGPLALMKAKEAERSGGVGTGARVLGWVAIALAALLALGFLVYGIMVAALIGSLSEMADTGSSAGALVLSLVG